MNRPWYFVAAAVIACSPGSRSADNALINVVAAENVYGDVARQIGGANVNVYSILGNPDQDPHLFEASVSTARALSSARVVIYNGVGYDPWMEQLLSASEAAGRRMIVVGELLHKRSGDNPHLWYDPAAMPALAKRIAAELAGADTAHKAEFERNLHEFLASLGPVNARVRAIRARYAGTPVTATESVFGYMAEALDLVMRNKRYQTAVMNNTEPAASDMAAFETDLKAHNVRLLFYNSQANDESAKRMRKLAADAHIPVVGVTETEPEGKRYQDWMLGQLDAVEKALSSTAP